MKKKRYILKPRIKLFLILLFLGYFAITVSKQIVRITKQKDEIQALKDEIVRVEDASIDLERMLRYSESEEFIERIAREKLGWVKKGDIIFIEKKEEN